MTRLSIGIFSIIMTMLSGCATKQVSELEWINSMCSTEKMPGETTGAKLLIEAKRQELESIKASISGEKYTKLSQELTGYNAQWESLNRDILLACKQAALCSYRICTPDNCTSQQERYDQAVSRANTFFLDVKKLDVGNRQTANNSGN